MDATVKIGNLYNGTQVDKGMYHRFILKYTKLAMYKILKYLKMTPGQGLFSQKVANREIEILPEVAWAFPVTKRHSTSGYCTFVWKNLVTWRSKKQLVVSRSSIEVEFRALSQGICDGIWFKRVLHEIGALNLVLIKVLYDNNKSAVKIAKNLFHCDRTKHVQMDHHFVTENIEIKTISLQYTPTSQQTTNILTKAFDNIWESYIQGRISQHLQRSMRESMEI
jgi:hypothetical protein